MPSIVAWGSGSTEEVAAMPVADKTPDLVPPPPTLSRIVDDEEDMR